MFRRSIYLLMPFKKRRILIASGWSRRKTVLQIVFTQIFTKQLSIVFKCFSSVFPFKWELVMVKKKLFVCLVNSTTCFWSVEAVIIGRWKLTIRVYSIFILIFLIYVRTYFYCLFTDSEREKVNDVTTKNVYVRKSLKS